MRSRKIEKKNAFVIYEVFFFLFSRYVLSQSIRKTTLKFCLPKHKIKTLCFSELFLINIINIFLVKLDQDVVSSV